MAAITSATRLFSGSAGGFTAALYQLSGVDSGDAINLASVGGITFKKVLTAVFFGQDQGLGVEGAISGSTTVTMTSSGMIDDAVLLLVQGVK